MVPTESRNPPQSALPAEIVPELVPNSRVHLCSSLTLRVHHSLLDHAQADRGKVQIQESEPEKRLRQVTRQPNGAHAQNRSEQLSIKQSMKLVQRSNLLLLNRITIPTVD